MQVFNDRIYSSLGEALEPVKPRPKQTKKKLAFQHYPYQRGVMEQMMSWLVSDMVKMEQMDFEDVDDMSLLVSDMEQMDSDNIDTQTSTWAHYVFCVICDTVIDFALKLRFCYD